jgi:hypothetical protein
MTSESLGVANQIRANAISNRDDPPRRRKIELYAPGSHPGKHELAPAESHEQVVGRPKRAFHPPRVYRLRGGRKHPARGRVPKQSGSAQRRSSQVLLGELLHGYEEIVQIERLHEVRVREGDTFVGPARRAGHEDEAHVRIVRASLSRELKPVAGRGDLQVGHEDTDRLGAQEPLGFLDRFGLHDAVAANLEIDTADQAHRRVVIQDQDRRPVCRREIAHPQSASAPPTVRAATAETTARTMRERFTRRAAPASEDGDPLARSP